MNYKNMIKEIQNELNTIKPIVDTSTIDKTNTNKMINTWITSLYIGISIVPHTQESQNTCRKAFNIKTTYVSAIINLLEQESSDSIKPENLGIDGKFVYASYNTPTKADLYAVLEKAIKINTLKKLFLKKMSIYNDIIMKLGIGLDTSKEIIDFTKQGYLLLPEKTVENARRYAEIGMLDNKYPLVVSPNIYSNTIATIKQLNSNADNWFTIHDDYAIGQYYMASIIQDSLNNEISEILRE